MQGGSVKQQERGSWGGLELKAKGRDTQPENTDGSIFSHTVLGSGCFSVRLRPSVLLFLSLPTTPAAASPQPALQPPGVFPASAHMSSSVSVAR